MRALGALPVLLLLACGATEPDPRPGPAAEPPAQIVLAVEHAAAPVVSAWIDALYGERPDRAPRVEPGDAAFSGARLLRGEVQGAVLARRPAEAETRAVAGADIGDREALRSLLLAREAVVFAVHARNPVPGFAPADLSALLAGEPLAWEDLGGAGGTIRLFGPAVGDSLTGALVNLGLPARLPEGTTLLSSGEAVARRTAETPAALGLTSGSALAGKHPPVVRTPGLRLEDGTTVFPTDSALGRPQWPLLRSLYLHSSGEAPGTLRALAEFARSDRGVEIARAYGWLPAAEVTRGTTPGRAGDEP